MRLLLVEDDDINRMSAEVGLRKLGHHVSSATNGLEALDALRAAEFDCVLMDIQMAGMDGVYRHPAHPQRGKAASATHTYPSWP